MKTGPNIGGEDSEGSGESRKAESKKQVTEVIIEKCTIQQKEGQEDHMQKALAHECAHGTNDKTTTRRYGQADAEYFILFNNASGLGIGLPDRISAGF